MASPGSPLLWRSFQVSRRGLAPEECQDAGAADALRRRFAVADGASESAYCGLWARLLVEDFVAGNGVDHASWMASLPALQGRWSREVDPRPGDPPLPWFVEERLRAGAFATFLGLSVEPAADEAGWHWHALAVGDSCLFQVRSGALVTSFPVQHTADFSSTPWLVGSRTAARGLHQASGPAQAGDRLYLMTDAMALWFLRFAEFGARPWEDLERLLAETDDTRFAAWVETLRQAHLLRDDDVTLLGVGL
jgi:hypothetical protein